jgi:hypothetical protein
MWWPFIVHFIPEVGLKFANLPANGKQVEVAEELEV